MRVGIAIVCVVVALLSTYGVITLVKGYQPAAPAKEVKKAKADPDVPPPPEDPLPSTGIHEPPKLNKRPPPISKTGPHPRAVIDKTEFDFGRMEVGESREHSFVIRNEGQADLILQQGNTTCQCTISKLENDRLPPGKSATITLRWTPTTQSETFEKGAEVFTNDPLNEKIHLKIVGMVAPRFVIMPADTWSAKDVKDGPPTEVKGYVASPIADDMKIEKLEYDEKYLIVEYEPVPQEMLPMMKSKAGFQFTVKVKPVMPVGAFTFPLRIHTNVPERKADSTLGDNAVIPVTINGYRRGPIRVMGEAYSEADGLITLGNFDARDGRSVLLSLLVRGAPEEGFRFDAVECDPAILQVTLDPDAKLQGAARRFKLTVAFPAGGERMTRRNEAMGSIKVKTNHPEAPVLDFKVQFSAF